MTAAGEKHARSMRGALACVLAGALACVFALIPTGVSRADQAPATPTAVPTVVLGGDAHYAPFQFIDADGHATGFDVELFRAVARQQHLQAKVQLGDWRGAMDGLVNGRVDVVPMLITPTRSRQFEFSQPYLMRYHLVFARQGQEHVTNLQQLAGRRVAVQFDSAAREALRGVGGTVQIVPTEVEADAIVAVHQGQADFAVVPIEIGYKAIVDHGYHDIVAISPPLLERKYVFGVRRGNEALLARIDAGLATLHSNGEMDALYMKWLANLAPQAVSRTRSRRLLWALLGLGVFFVVALALWWRAKRHAATQTTLAATESRSRKNAEARIEHLAWHDAATDLPNVNALQRRMQNAVRSDRPFGFVRLDILDLNLTQASAGSRFTDKLLLALARRLRQSCPAGTVAALGRGVYGVMLDSVRDKHAAEQRMRALVVAVHRPLQLGDVTVQQRCRAGLACFPLDASDTEGMLRAAETACSAAHEHATVMMSYAGHLEPDPRNLTLLADLSEAIADASLDCAMQPKFRLQDRTFCGAEMLVRWTHPRHGVLEPGQFVPLAAKTGAIGELTLYVVRAALLQWQRWRARGVALSVAVNISGNDLANEPLIGRIVSLCREIGPALTLEITETEMIRDPHRALAAIALLRGTGVRVSLDDFGTGYSSFTALRQLAPDELKIDRSFVAQLLTSPDDQAIARACITLAHELGASVIAEGVEDEATLRWLAAHGCDMAQGYVLAKPMPPDDLFVRYTRTAPVA